MTHKIIKFDDNINFQLRQIYLQSLARPVSYDSGKTTRPRVRKHEAWNAIPPFGRHGWGATKGVFANHTNPLDITTGQKVWVWSDLHFGHKNIIRFSNRPFPDVPTMDEMLVQNFNALVQPDDISIWVGDVAFLQDTEANKLLHRCNGYKIQIVGNHDFNKRNLKKLHFNETHIVYNLQINDRVVAFTHYPMDNLPKGWYNIHGHVHIGKADLSSNRHINVNCEFIDYKPIRLETLADKIEELAQNQDDKISFDYEEYD